MIDFSKIFDIVFASVAVALILFLLVSTIVVASRGKRKCGGFDVALRIVSSLVLAVAAVMFAAAILTMLDGSFRILLESQAPDKTVAYFVMNGSKTELPLVDLFILLSSVVGSNLVAMLLICALAALIVDCVVANKKEVKRRPYKNEKTLEQRKREAELRRIRNLGEAAVRKADAAASQDGATIKQPQDDEPQTDWREEPQASEEQTEFVGIKDDQNDDFDSFDEPVDGPEVEQEVGTTEQEEQVADEQVEELVQDEPVIDDEEIIQDEAVVDEFTEQEELVDEAYATDEAEEEASEEEGAYNDEFIEEEQLTEEAVDDEIVEQDFIDDASIEQESEVADEEADEDDMSKWAFESDEQVETETEQTVEDEVAADSADDSAADDVRSVDDVEPDRNIYIPEMRTIEPTPKKAEAKPTSQAKKAPDKPKAKPATKPKKPAAKKQKTVQPEKKLPVTRKYVILDRRNAVNMFGEYLKERNKAQKEKLESSIDTIIIE